jgi:hypothetical protein
MCLHALSLSFVIHYHYLYEKGRSGETMILGSILAIRKFLVTFMLFSFSSSTHKNHKKLVSYFVYFGFVNLRVVGD